MTTLSGEFQKTLTFKPDDIRHLIDDAHVIEGAKEFYSGQGLITDHVRKGGQVCEWLMSGKPSVLIMPEKIGKALLECIGLELKEVYQDPNKVDLRRMRDGEIALAQTRVNSSLAIMITKDKVEEALVRMKRGQSAEGRLYDRLEGFLGDNNLTPQKFIDILNGIDANPEELDRLKGIAVRGDDFDL